MATSEQVAGSEVRVLARGLAILKAFEPDNKWRSNTELAISTGLPKPTVSRLTANLTEAGYLVYSAERASYGLATSVLTLGFLAASNRDLIVVARPLMQEFADQHNVSVVLASPDGDTMVCHEVVHSRSMLFTLRVRAGSRLQMGPSALGRALVGSMGDAERDRFLARLSRAGAPGLAELQEHVKAAVAQMKRRQYCIAAGSLEQGTNGVAVVIDTPQQPHSYAIGCAAPTNTLSVTRIESSVAPDLLGLKARLEAEINATSAQTES
jgi:DNA-binding IclR family transcriptional regulator